MSNNTILFLNDLSELKKNATEEKRKSSYALKRHKIHIELTPEEYYVLSVLADVSFSSRTSIAHELIAEFANIMGGFIEEGQGDIAFLHMELVAMEDVNE